MTERSCQVVILAAGEGTRMKSSISKVLHPVAGLPMLGHVIATGRSAGADGMAVVAGSSAVDVVAQADASGMTIQTHIQEPRLGTAHAVLAARAQLQNTADDVLILYGDTPLIRPETLAAMRTALAGGADLVVLGFQAKDPGGYGRLITRGDMLTAIREERDASLEERAITMCNAGAMAFRGPLLLPILDRIGNKNAKGEFYLTDAVAIANSDGLRVGYIVAEEDEVLGVNSRTELATAERIWQNRRRASAMADGVTLLAPETVFFSHDTVVGGDVTIEPNVFFGPGVAIDSGAVIRAFCHIEGAHVGAGSSIGPFARLRPGADIGDNGKIGNFCEIKNAEIGAGAKVNHLSYIGDSTVGAQANIGAGTVTCNYDGVSKYRTEIGSGSFVGSNSALVAPITIGDNAYVASGSVITEDVPDGALAVARGRQSNKLGWVARFRSRQRD